MPKKIIKRTQGAETLYFGTHTDAVQAEYNNNVVPLTSLITTILTQIANRYTKSEVDALVANIHQFSIEIVSSLPTASADTMWKIYLIPSTNPETQNVKDEFVTVQDGNTYRWEQIGSTAIDLSDYSTTAQMNAAIASALSTALASYSTTTQMNNTISTALQAYYTKSQVDSALTGKQDVIDDLSDIRSGAAAGATAVQPSILTENIAKLGVSNNVILNEYVAEIYVSSGADITQIDFAIASPGSGDHVGEYLNLFRLRTASNQSYHLFFSPTYYETQSAALTAWEEEFADRVVFNLNHTFGVAFTGKPFAQVSQIAATPTNSDMSNLSTMPLIKGYLLPLTGESITGDVEFNRYVREIICTRTLDASTAYLKVSMYIGYLTSSAYHNFLRIYEYSSNGTAIGNFDMYHESYETLQSAIDDAPTGIKTGTNGKVLFGNMDKEFYKNLLSVNHPLTEEYAPSLKASKLDGEINKLITGLLVDENLEDIEDSEFKYVTVDCIEDERYEATVSLTFDEDLDEGDDDEVIATVYVRYYPAGQGTKTLDTTTITRSNTSTSIIFQPVMSLPHNIIVKNTSGQTFNAEVTVKKQDTPIEVATPFKILYIGSSLGIHATLYAPPILLDMGITNYTIAYAFKGGCELSETLDALNGNTSVLYEYNKWSAGSIAWDTTPSDPQNPVDLNYLPNILVDEAWDCVVISQAAHLIFGDYDTNFAPYINDVCYKIYDIVGSPIKLGWNAICAGYINLTDTFENTNSLLENRWEDIIANTQRVVAETPVEFVIASGTAMQNARSTSLNTCGFYGHLISDADGHPNDGLPRFVLGYYTAIKLIELMGIHHKSILGNKLLFNNKSFITKYNTMHMERGVSGQTGYDGRTYPWYDAVDALPRYVAQLCAIAAVKEPYEITEITEPNE